MDNMADFFAVENDPRTRLSPLLKHFSKLRDDREPWRMVYPLAEVLRLTCSTIAACDDFDEIVARGKHHLDFLRKFAPYCHGIPCERWLNRVERRTFAAPCPDRHDLIAIDGARSLRRREHGMAARRGVQGRSVAVLRRAHAKNMVVVRRLRTSCAPTNRREASKRAENKLVGSRITPSKSYK
jgi:DDE_Tnp_1-associated